jgi:hypothetical protein
LEEEISINKFSFSTVVFFRIKTPFHRSFLHLGVVVPKTKDKFFRLIRKGKKENEQINNES